MDLGEGDMLDVAAFAPEIAGSDVVFHTAAYFREYLRGGDPDGLLRKINVEGTVELLEAAAAQGVGDFAYASAGGVLGGRAAAARRRARAAAVRRARPAAPRRPATAPRLGSLA